MRRIFMGGYDALFASLLHSGRGRVHSVFPHAVNLISEGRLYTVLSGAHMPAPCTAWADATDFRGLEISPGDRVQATGKTVTIDSRIVLDFCVGAMCDPCFQAVPWDRERVLAGLWELERHLPGYQNRSAAAAFYLAFFAGGEPSFDCVQRELALRMERLMQAFPHREAVAFHARELIGAGIGLTPTGDDFLCGLLLAFLRAGWDGADAFARCLSTGVSQALETKTTTDISRQMLRFHLCGRAPRLYEQLVEDLLGGACPRIPEDILKLAAVGYSSGIDFACGAAGGLRLLLTQYN
ncbi:DUF2877 domain-containing protein [Flavonifractor porci]|uniref:DUF2877 domain-containing protein n=1 Tax=Flavonifractor porci TaxID=3133422 RepID=UPI0030AEEC15